MNEYLPGIVWLVVLLIVNGFFVGAEFAVISARRSQIEPRAEAGSKAAKKTLWAMEHATLMLATSQLGITVCSLVILNVSEPAIHHLLEIPLGLTSLSAEAIGVVAFVVALVLVTFLHVVVGEMIPKNLSFSVPDRAALILAPPLVFVATVFKPVIWSLNAIANGVLRLFRVEPKDEATSSYTLDEVATIVQQSTREGTLTDSSGTLSAAFEFTTRKVRDVEVPLDEMVHLAPGSTPSDVQRAVAARGYSRYVLTDGDGQPTGYLHLKDVMDLTGDGAFEAPVPEKRIRRLGAVGRDTDLEDALASMRRVGAHVARSVSPEGVTTGVLFLEDIIEELVGEVDDVTAV
ncbi:MULTISPECIES: hemolysin family protein [unclassified Frigoribacterium]|jgi:CBS domain containing-hemolysin-like protein|uniref:hemolysin family protein n=1 Tax=unclassified Frigoribacterium TaxID=2627005 RepID=UPI001903E013|nr:MULTISPECIES: hemolysin family protein [unclassified Frigoribacterium]MBD8141473.1 HlyC/CorC family transporter [Frigoribacterium sp. CFBP 13605]WAC51355.1 hemolysin family protein [Frigoribacterium sp. SL97]